MNSSMVQSTANCPSSYNNAAPTTVTATLNNNSIALTLDQTQLQQITQLMNEMQQQDLNYNPLINANNNNSSSNASTENSNTNISIDVSHHQHHNNNNHNHVDSNINQNQLIFSPDSIVKLESQIQYQQQAAYQQMAPQSNQIILDNQQQQQQQQQQITQVHTIMLNGQPALFIPASSAMSSNLLSQMLMNNNSTLTNSEAQSSSLNSVNNSTNTNSNNQNFDLNSMNLQYNTINQLMPDVLNGINENTMTSNKNAQLTSSKQQHNPRQVSPKRQQKQNSNNNNNSLNQNSNNQRLLQQQQTQNQQQQQSQMVNLSQILNQSTSGNSNDLSNFLLNMNGVNIDLESLVSSNIHHQQQHQQQQQQIICIQPDGNLVFQTVHQPSFQQQIFQQENNTFNSLENLNKPQQETNTLTNNKKRKNTTTPSSVTANNTETKVNNSNKKTKANTVARVLANGIHTTTSESSPVKIKKNYKVANLLSSSENKLKVDLLPGQQFQPDSNMQQPQQQQWVLINSSNNLSQFTNMEAILSTNSMSNSENNKTLNESNKNSIVKQKQKHGTTKKEKILLNDEANELMKLYHSIGNDDKADYVRNNTSKTSNDTENKDDGSLLENENENENGGKKKRKACECPNCLKWKHDTEYREENSHRRTHSCHKCPKVYNKTSHLRAHLRAHDNYRPYICDYATCRKSFTRSDELKRHKRIHNDDRNFPCTLCKKKFLRSDHLAKHYLVHKKTITTAQAAALIPSPKKPLPQKQIRKLISEQEIKREEEASSIASSSSSASSTTE